MSELFYVPGSPVFGRTGLLAGAATISFYKTGTTPPQNGYSDPAKLHKDARWLFERLGYVEIERSYSKTFFREAV